MCPIHANPTFFGQAYHPKLNSNETGDKNLFFFTTKKGALCPPSGGSAQPPYGRATVKVVTSFCDSTQTAP